VNYVPFCHLQYITKSFYKPGGQKKKPIKIYKFWERKKKEKGAYRRSHLNTNRLLVLSHAVSVASRLGGVEVGEGDGGRCGDGGS